MWLGSTLFAFQSAVTGLLKTSKVFKMHEMDLIKFWDKYVKS